MSLSARRIALQGFGAGALFVALQGLVPVTQVEPPPPVVGATGGGGQVSQSEWLRRFGPKPEQVDQVAIADSIDQAKAARDAMRKRRKREEVLLLLLS
jgi:hypothetical protein